MPRTRWHARQSIIAIWLVIMATCGCTSINKGPADNVITSRQLAQSGMVALQQGQWDQAENLFRLAIESCPTDERTRVHFAETLWKQGSGAEAIAQMNEALQLSGGDPDLSVRLGQMYLAQDQFDESAYCAERAIWSNPQLAAAWALRGDVLHRRNLLDEALASYHRSLSYQSHYPQVQMAVARTYDQLGKPQRTLTTLEALAEHYPPGHEPHELLVLHGTTLKQLGRYAEAVESLLAASSQREPSADVLFQLAEAQWFAGDQSRAEQSVLAALSVDPAHPPSQLLISHIQRRQENITVSLRQ